MASPVQYVCWEWLRDDQLGYSPYPPEDSYEIEKVYSKNRRGKVKLKEFTVNLAKLKEERHTGYGGYHQIHRNTNISLPAHGGTCAYWMWCNKKPDGFVPYNVAATVDIEEGYMKHCNGGKEILNLANYPSGIPYTINFSNWNQTRHGYMTIRDIKRVQLQFGQTLQFLLQVLPPTSTPLHSSSLGPGIHSALPLSTGSISGTLTLPGVGSFVSSTPGYGGTGGTTSLGGGVGYGGVASGGALIGTSASSSAHFTPVVPHNGYLGPSSTTLPSHFCSTCYPSSCTCGPFCSACYPSPCTCGSLSASHVPTSHTASVSIAGGTSPYYTRSSTHSSHGASLYATSPALNPVPAHKGSRPPTTSISAHTSASSSSASSSSSSSKSRGRRKKTTVTGKASPTISQNSMKSASRRKKKGRTCDEQEEGKVSSGGEASLMVHFKKVKNLKEKDDEPCPICMNKLSESSGFDDEDDASPASTASQPLNVYKLRRCGHKLHHACLQMYLKSLSQGQGSGFQCPTCKKSYGVKTGDMPDGTMSTSKSRSSLPGHSGCGRIEITYDFKSGVYNGHHYRTNGFPRVCYLPDSAKGQKVLRLLKLAWERRLTFTIGTSVTTGATDTVVWNEIHHKTESSSNHSGHGYPDPDYLDRVLLELAAQGVEDKQEEEEKVSSSSAEDSDD